MKHRFLIPILALASALLSGCGTAKQMQIVTQVQRDTLYLNKVQYDSVYVYQNLQTDRSRDTIYIKDVQYQYKYKFLRDTCYIHKVDTIPVIHEVEVTKEVKYIPWWSKVLNWIGGISLLIIIFYIVYKVIKLYLK